MTVVCVCVCVCVCSSGRLNPHGLSTSTLRYMYVYIYIHVLHYGLIHPHANNYMYQGRPGFRGYSTQPWHMYVHVYTYMNSMVGSNIRGFM